MINLRTISTSLILATTFLSSSISLVHAMDQTDKEQIASPTCHRAPAHTMTEAEQSYIQSLTGFKVEPDTQQNESEDPNSLFALTISLSLRDRNTSDCYRMYK